MFGVHMYLLMCGSRRDIQQPRRTWSKGNACNPYGVRSTYIQHSVLYIRSNTRIDLFPLAALYYIQYIQYDNYGVCTVWRWLGRSDARRTADRWETASFSSNHQGFGRFSHTVVEGPGILDLTSVDGMLIRSHYIHVPILRALYCIFLGSTSSTPWIWSAEDLRPL